MLRVDRFLREEYSSALYISGSTLPLHAHCYREIWLLVSADEQRKILDAKSDLLTSFDTD